MFTLILSLIILAAVLLVLVILAQNSKGGGLSSQFGGAGASNMIGVKKTGDLLEKMTWGLVIVVFALTLSTNFILNERQGPTDEFRDRAREEAGGAPTLDLGDIEEQPANDEGRGLEDLSTDPDTSN
ncbi:protein-export membrane protein [Fulvivirga imtechensis AK7]|uniref:Protein-export membrane protein SecG n=1 Tax=Fulvivirga imtechensis AK7 TaxID=1237149 RepID=L8JPP7_9BACT|nr:preprotein translocase subunit SecG [Fulvivirga imtechensis]ELR69342.1 protein-export membrane protein [Fulvivirga imtechensis AK7]